MKAFKLSERSRKRLVGIDSRLLDVVELAIRLSPIDFGIPKDGGLRTTERQKEIYDSGASKVDGVSKLSKHQSGKAFDFVCYDDSGLTWNPDHYFIVWGVIYACGVQKGLHLRWGGNWDGDSNFNDQTFNDLGHVEIVE